MPDSKRFKVTLESGAPLIQVVTYETLRLHGLVSKAAKELGYQWYAWNRIEGLKKWDKERKAFDVPNEDLRSPSRILEHFASEEFPGKSLLILEDFHPDLNEGQPETIRRLRNIAIWPPHQKHIILCQPFPLIPKELEKEMQLMELRLPEADDLKTVMENVAKSFQLPTDLPCDTLLDAALGLTIMEAKTAFAKAAAQNNQLTNDEVEFIVAEKEQVIKKSGFLEYFHPDKDLKDVGGLEVLKEWLKKRGRAFTKHAREFHLESPRGVLLLGIPGTGKSLTAKAIASAWQFPLLKLDMGKIFGGIVGQSESNIRNALQIAEAMAPCVLWIDEIEKGMAGLESSGATDGGTTSRVMSTFLTWLQEKTRPVFVVATANRIGQLPPELLRKGRIDEIFFVDLPSAAARREIFEIHLKRKQREPDQFQIDELLENSNGFSGAEIEEAIKDALFTAFDEGIDLTTRHILKALRSTTPLARTRSEEISQMRAWAKSRAVMASSETPVELPKEDPAAKAPKLRSEMVQNPFITD
jgi:ATP-dependent 26S proteasome regulatory subunit